MPTAVIEPVATVEEIAAANPTQTKRPVDVICYYFGRDCSCHQCDGFGNCWDYETEAEIIHRQKFEKKYK